MFKIVVSLAGALSVGLATGVEIQVPRDYATIQAALDVAVDGDRVRVAPGRWRERLVVPDVAVALTSLDPRDREIVRATVLDAESRGTALRFSDGAGRGTIVSGFTIENGLALRGGGVFVGPAVADGGSPALEFCRIQRNRSVGVEYGDGGGGIYCADGAAPRIVECEIVENSAARAGAGLCAYFADVDVTRSLFWGNVAERWGGGIYAFGGYVEVLATTLSVNRAGEFGGGLRAFDASIELTNCIVDRNRAGGHGGGLDFRLGGRQRVEYCSLAHNAAPAGGAIHVSETDSVEVWGSILWANGSSPVGMDAGRPEISWSNVQFGWEGVGNIHEPPGWIRWRQWRYVPRPGSPSIDAGSPADGDGHGWPLSYRNDPGRADQGAYGGPGGVGWLPEG